MPNEEKPAQPVKTATQKLASRALFMSPEARKVRFTVLEDIPVLGNVRVRSLNDKEHTRIISAQFRTNGSVDKAMASSQAARLVVATVVDEEGNQLFTSNDVDELRQMDTSIMEPLVKGIRAHLGISEDAGSEDEEKN